MKRTKYIILLCLTGIASALAFCACRTKPLNASVSSNDSVSTAERETGGSYFWESSYSQSEENGSNETSVSMESSSQSTEDFSSTESSSSYEESASSQESSSNTENLESSFEKDDTFVRI